MRAAKIQPVVSLRWPQVVSWRHARHYLQTPATRRHMLRVVRQICGLHAQVMSSAELTLRARVDGIERTHVQDALWKRKKLVKTWAMRGTLHIFTADDYWIYQGATSTYEHYLNPRWLEITGSTVKDVTRVMDAIHAALDGNVLTREELADEVARRTTKKFGELLRSGWGSWLKPAAFHGLLCFGPSRGPKVTFARPDQWLGVEPPKLSPEAAISEVVRRYLRAYGCATREALARWWAIRPPQAQKLIEALGDEVAPVDVEGARAWVLESDVEELRSLKTTRAKPVNLLPAFDPYLVGAPRRVEAAYPVKLHEDIYNRPAAWLPAPIVVGGRMQGEWKFARKGKGVDMALIPWETTSPQLRKRIEKEARLVARFLGAAPELSWERYRATKSSSRSPRKTQ